MAVLNIAQFQIRTQPDPNNPQNIKIQVSGHAHALYSGGVVLDVVVGVDVATLEAMKQAGQVPPQPVIIQALVDTGCTVTSIDDTLVKSMNLQVRGFTTIATANGTKQVTQHSIALGFPQTQLKGRDALLVNSVDLAGQPFKMLIGRDIMSGWVIVYNGTMGAVSISD